MCVLRKCVVGRTEGGRGDRGRENIPIPPRPIFTRKSGNGGGGTTNDRLNSLFPRKKEEKIERRKRRTTHPFPPSLAFMHSAERDLCDRVLSPFVAKRWSPSSSLFSPLPLWVTSSYTCKQREKEERGGMREGASRKPEVVGGKGERWTSPPLPTVSFFLFFSHVL